MSILSTQLSTYIFENHIVRTTIQNGELWFIAADVCKALKLENTTKSIRNLDPDEKALTLIQGLNRGNEPVNIINESGMYTLVLRCRDAVNVGTIPHRFRKWVTSEVLPQIRKTGSYNQPHPTFAQIPHEGRWLVLHNNSETKVINIDGRNCVDSNLFRQLQKDAHFFAKEIQLMQTQLTQFLTLSQNFATRTRITSGECDPALLKMPLKDVISK